MSPTAESKYRLIFNNAPIEIFHFDDTGEITACNDQFVSILGSTREHLIGLDITALPDNKVTESVQKALIGEKGYYEVTTNQLPPAKSFP